MKDQSLEAVAAMDLDELGSLNNQAQRLLDHIQKSRDEQPDRLAKAREEADEARGWALIEEPWESQITALPAHNADGKRTGNALTVPNIVAKELFASRLAFDMLDAGDDYDRLEEVKTRYFTMLGGDTGSLFLLFAAALDTVASLVVPQMIDELETRASNYDVRVMIAEARAKAWAGRVSELRGPLDDDTESAGGDDVY